MATVQHRLKTKQNIRILVGPYRSGKSLAMLKDVVEHCTHHKTDEAFIVVPSHRYKKLVETRLAKVLTSSSAPGITGIRIVTFYQLCETILTRNSIFPRLIPDSVRSRVVEIVLKELAENNRLKALQPVAEYTGTAKAILDLIDELQRSSLSPSHVILRLEETAAQNTRYMELGKVYEAYWKKLDDIGYIDERRTAYKLLELCGAPEIPGVPEVIVFDGFDRFNPLQLRVISAIAEHAQNLTLSFDYASDEDETLHWGMERFEHSRPYEWKSASFKQLNDILGGQSTIVTQPDKRQIAPNLSAFVAADRYLEMAQIAASIKRSILIDGRDPNQILVTTRNLRSYGQAVAAAFDDAGLECFIDEPIQLLALPIVQFLYKLLEVNSLDLPRPQLMWTLRNRFFKKQPFQISDFELGLLDEKSLDMNVIGGRTQWQHAAESIAGDLVQKLNKVFDALAPQTPITNTYSFVSWAEDLFDNLLILPSHGELAPFEEWELRSAIAQFRNALAELLQEDNLDSSLGLHRKRSFEELLQRLQMHLEKSNFRRLARTKNAILVCSAELAPSRMFDEVYIAGLVEGEFPKRTVRGGFVSTDEVAAWATYGIDIHNPRFEPGYEPALLHALFKLARKKVIASTSTGDVSGEELIPAFLFTEIAKSNATTFVTEDYFANQLAQPVSPRNVILASNWLRTTLKTENPVVVQIKDQLAEPYMVMGARTAPISINSYNGFLTDLVTSKSISIKEPAFWSASQLNEYGKCHFRFWVSKVLKIDPVKEPEERLSRKDLGTAFHRVLELFYNDLIARSIGILDLTEEETEALAEAKLKVLFEELDAQNILRKGEFWLYHKREISFRVKRFLQEERQRAIRSSERYKPFATEVAFGFDEEGSSPPLRIKTKEQPILVRGRIDRIDQMLGTDGEPTERFRVIDYKSGAGGISTEDQMLGTSMQLPLYGLAIEREIQPNSKVTGGSYLSVLSGKSIGRLFPRHHNSSSSSPQDYQPLPHTEELVANLVQKIRSGSFVIRPAMPKVCKSCDQIMVCRTKEMVGEESDQW
jgi:ATP-dependent helicase/nuclease subunit B